MDCRPSVCFFICSIHSTPPGRPNAVHMMLTTINSAFLNLSCGASCRDQSDYLEFSGSGSADDEYLPLYHRSPKINMTRLDPPPHRPNPRAWMDEARSRDGFTSRSGGKKMEPEMMLNVSVSRRQQIFILVGRPSPKNYSKRRSTEQMASDPSFEHVALCSFCKPVTYAPRRIWFQPKVFFT